MRRPSWTTVTPLLAAVALVPSPGSLHPDSAPVLGILAVLLVGAVLAAVHHAEVVAHRVGEPYGSLVLAVAVTIIEVGLIVTLMVTTDKDTAGLARDTVFAAVMITVNGIVASRCSSARSSTTSRSSTPRAPAPRWPPSSPSPCCASSCPR